jgi:hypothetical protein
MTPADQHGGLFCSVCGTRNADGRTYCRYCGHPLDVTVPVPVRRRWWQRLFGRKKRTKTAGDRPRRFYRKDPSARAARRQAKLNSGRSRLSRLNGPLAKLTPVLAILSLVGIGLGPARSWINKQASTVFGTAKKATNRHYLPVSPVSATASTAAGGHGPKLVIDGVRDTWWQSKGHPDGIGETITVRFANEVDLSRIGILSGAKGDQFRTEARPQTMQITADGKPQGQLSFDDKPDFQAKGVKLRNVTSITLVITAAYPGQKAHMVAIRELQFFSLKVG